jgi:glycosyltransferase involved in cell wall biosynthesis
VRVAMGRGQSVTPQGRPLVSIVTPAHNEEANLRECIESVLAQTYGNWDYTIVNNRSTDHTLEIAREYAARDRRIRVRDNDVFVSMIDNFNNAFRSISAGSKYCKPIGADDWLYPECLERMVELAEQHPDVAIVGAYWRSGPFVVPTALPFDGSIVAGPDLCRAYLLDMQYFPMGPSPLLFRADVVRSREPFYRGQHLHTDALACFEILQEPNDFGFVHQVLTFNRLRDNSMTGYSRHYNTYAAQNLDVLERFGPRHLTEAELRRRVRRELSSYYNYLASQVHLRRGRQFWSMHRACLAELDHPLNVGRLGVNAVFHAIEALVRRMRRGL